MAERKVLVLGSYRQTVTIVRSLARAGYGVIGVAELYSRLARAGRCAWRSEYHLGCWWRDPMPTFFSLWRAVRRVLGRQIGLRPASRRAGAAGVAR